VLLAGEEGFSRSWRRFGGALGRAEARCLGQPDRIYSILHWVCRWHRQCLAFPSLHISQWRWYVRARNRAPTCVSIPWYTWEMHASDATVVLYVVRCVSGHDEIA